MAFFNYSTMQMTAKIVYYGPGLCGKTTNLQFIYDHTTNESRGEMVSLETQTDRTLFFDLLPMEVGSVAGFKTRIQLYTVPGQVFYNTTRKLVLKGVDGVVFVADSQRPMLAANQEAMDNLGENLESLGLSLDSVPMVLQYNKRDLPDIATVEELSELLHRSAWPTFEASAITGAGVVETLRGISKLTLIALRKQLESSAAVVDTSPRVAAPASVAPMPAPQPAATQKPAATPQPAATPVPTPQARPSGDPVSPPPPAPRRPAAPVRAAVPTPTPEPTPVPETFAPPQPRKPITVRRDLRVDLKQVDAAAATRRVQVALRIEDSSNRVLGSLEDLDIDIDPATAVDSLLLRLNVTLQPED